MKNSWKNVAILDGYDFSYFFHKTPADHDRYWTAWELKVTSLNRNI